MILTPLLKRSAKGLSWKSLCFFSSTTSRREIRDVAELPERLHPEYHDTKHLELLCLHWPCPPRNVLITKKNSDPSITKSLVELAHHIHTTYPHVNLILEPHAAEEVHEQLCFPVYSSPTPRHEAPPVLRNKVDLIATLGGDGTILHASSLFATAKRVPPILSFSMGTLGFLGEWKFKEYKRAFREVYMSGAGVRYGSSLFEEDQPAAPCPDAPKESIAKDPCDSSAHIHPSTPMGWSSIRGMSMGNGRGARILLRNRLKVQIVSPSSRNPPPPIHAMNEVILHRGADPHLAIVEVFVGGRFLTEAVADGIIVSTPTGSTAYSLSSGGSIVHPLVSSLLLTPVCPRSLSFRPLVLPANTPITLRLSEKNRGREVDVSIDGVKSSVAVGVGMEVRVWGEDIRNREGVWCGGVPSIVRGRENGAGGEDHWVGGLNGLLKFNYPFGEET
ncbi:ATP-NAD kinase [Patellaria atrata CBS 101060]|uniref:ATP-NAD kinase n=1 Tax=Patellaria atrata CBS 101060 TaxID=1346257 RepID=A0A9P4VVE7_9PEZI|nr:ATP-NAD kinase [Patellaria atrata CBS 101060]